MKVIQPFRIICFLMAAFCAVSAKAVEPNAVFTIKVNELNYAVPEQKNSAGKVIGTVLEAIAGEATNTQNTQYAPAVSALVRSAFTDVRRLAPVASNEDAQFDLSGDITSIVTHTTSRTVDRTDSKGKSYKELINTHEASIGVTLTLTEYATGQQWTNSFSANTAWYEDPLTENDAFTIVSNRLRDNIVKAYNGMFPLVAHIVESGAVKKDKQKDVYIDLGDINGIYKGLHFEVFELSTIAGRETRKRLGKLTVEEVMGEDISRCKVDKGAKEIKSAIDAGKTLLVTSID